MGQLGKSSLYARGNGLIGTCSLALGGTDCAMEHMWENA